LLNGLINAPATIAPSEIVGRFLHHFVLCVERHRQLASASELQGSAMGNPMQPSCEQMRVSERRCFAGQDEEGGLEGIFSILMVAQ
jgi:hypothetical protein